MGKVGHYFMDATTGDIVSVTTKEELVKRAEKLLKATQ